MVYFHRIINNDWIMILLIILPSTEQFSSSYKAVRLLKFYITVHYITIIIEEKNKDALMLNKTRNVKLNWQKVNETKYVWAIHSITTNIDVESFNDERFGVIVAGYDISSWESYGYPAGFKFPGGMSNFRRRNLLTTERTDEHF